MEVRTNMTWKQITPTTQSIPDPRAEFCLVIDKNDNLFLYGGNMGSNVRYGDMWMFSTTSLAWNQLRDNNLTLVKGQIGQGDETTRPGSRVFHMCWYDMRTHEMWLHGRMPLGSFDSKLSDMWSYSIDTDIWTLRIDTYSGTVTNSYIDPVNDLTVRNVTIASYCPYQSQTIDSDGYVW